MYVWESLCCNAWAYFFFHFVLHFDDYIKLVFDPFVLPLLALTLLATETIVCCFILCYVMLLLMIGEREDFSFFIALCVFIAICKLKKKKTFIEFEDEVKNCNRVQKIIITNKIPNLRKSLSVASKIKKKLFIHTYVQQRSNYICIICKSRQISFTISSLQQ